MNSIYTRRTWDKVSSKEASAEIYIDLQKILRIVKRQRLVIVACVGAGLFLALLYLAAAQRQYTATAQILIDQNRAKFLEQISGFAASRETDYYISGQVALINSDSLAVIVAGNLNVPTMENFHLGADKSLYWSIRESVGSLLRATGIASLLDDVKNETSAEPEEKDPLVAAAYRLKTGVAAYRVERSPVIEISYAFPDAIVARKIAQEYAEAYVQDQQRSNTQAAQGAIFWLEERKEQLRDQTLDANASVEMFRSDNGLAAADGRLIADQRLATISSQLVEAQALTAKAEARVATVAEALEEGNVEAIVALAVLSHGDERMSDLSLRDSYNQAVQRQADIIKRWGRDHPQAAIVLQQKVQLAEIARAQVENFLQTYRDEANIARLNEEALEASFREALDASNKANSTSVTLRDLEQQAESSSTLYQNYLQRYQEAVQQQFLPLSTARIISAADTPREASSPNAKLVLALGLFAGAAAGAGLGIMREYRERFFRTGLEVYEFSVEFLGYVASAQRSKLQSAFRRVFRRRKHGLRPMPSLQFGEAFSNIQVASDTFGLPDQKSIGFLSILPNEGKTEASLAYAELSARDGHRVLLVDANIRNQGLTKRILADRQMGPSSSIATMGLFGTHAIMLGPNLMFLPAAATPAISSPLQAIRSSAMANCLCKWKEVFDVIIFDLPCMEKGPEVKAFLRHIDGAVLVIEWGRTPRSSISSHLQFDELLRSKLLGAILNRVELSKLKYYT